MRDEIIEVLTQYNDGTGIKKSKKTIFAEKKSVAREEFYKAYASGVTPKMIFSMDQLDYKSCNVYVEGKKFKPTHIIYDGETFMIVRDFEIGIHNVEVTVK